MQKLTKLLSKAYTFVFLLSLLFSSKSFALFNNSVFLPVDGNPVGFPLVVFRTLTGEKNQQIVVFLQLVHVGVQSGHDIDQRGLLLGLVGEERDPFEILLGNSLFV